MNHPIVIMNSQEQQSVHFCTLQLPDAYPAVGSFALNCWGVFNYRLPKVTSFFSPLL